MPWPGNTNAVGSGSTIASPSATSVSPARTRTWITPTPADHGDARGLEVEDRAERDGREERHPPVAEQRRVAAAERVDDERRRARGGPGTVRDRPRRAPPCARRARTGAAGCGRRRRARRPPSSCGAASSAVASVRAGRGSRSGPVVASRARADATGLLADEGAAAGRGRPSDGDAPRIVAIVSPARSIVPVADQRGSPSCGTSTVVSARTRRTSPVASSAVRVSQGWAARKSASPGSASVSVRSWRSRRRSANAVAGASPRMASSASTSATTPRAEVSRAWQRSRVGAPAGSSSSTSRAVGLPRLARPRRPRGAGRDRVRGVDELRQPRRELGVREQRRQRRPGEREREVGGHAVVRRAGRGAVRARKVGRARPGRDDALQRVVDRYRSGQRRAARAANAARAAGTDSTRRRLRQAPTAHRAARGASVPSRRSRRTACARAPFAARRGGALGNGPVRTESGAPPSGRKRRTSGSPVAVSIVTTASSPSACERDRLDGRRGRTKNDRSLVRGDRVAGDDEAPERVRAHAAVLAHDALGGAQRGDRARAGGVLAQRRRGRSRGGEALTRHGVAGAGDRGRLEAGEQVGDRLVGAGDAGDGLRTGDDEDLVGVEAVVLGLPEPVGHVPAADLGVQDGHERHRLAGAVADLEEELGVGGVQQRRRGRRVRERERAAAPPRGSSSESENVIGPDSAALRRAAKRSNSASARARQLGWPQAPSS